VPGQRGVSAGTAFAPDVANASGSKGVNVRWCWADDTPGDPATAFKNGLLSPYLNNCTEIAGCPAFRTPFDVAAFYRQVKLAYPLAVHYGYNGLLLGERHKGFYGSDPRAPGYRSWVGYTASRVRTPSSAAMFADSAELLVGKIVPTPTICPPLSVYWPDGSLRAKPLASVHGRHPGDRANVAWVDGHVSSKPVSIYEDQPANQQTARVGYLSPPGPVRDNGWMNAE